MGKRFRIQGHFCLYQAWASAQAPIRSLLLPWKAWLESVFVIHCCGSGKAWLGQVLASCNEGVSWGHSHLQAQLVRLLFQVHSTVAGRIRLIHGCWPEAILSFLPCGPLWRAAHNMAAGFIRMRPREPERKFEQGGSHSLITQTQKSYFDCILIRSMSLDPAYTQGKGATLEHECQEVRRGEGHLRSHPLQSSLWAQDISSCRELWSIHWINQKLRVMDKLADKSLSGPLSLFTAIFSTSNNFSVFKHRWWRCRQTEGPGFLLGLLRKRDCWFSRLPFPFWSD